MPSSSTTIPEVDLEPQWYHTSCWAACLAMAARMLAPGSDKDQCYFIHEKEKGKKYGCKKTIKDAENNLIEQNVYLDGHNDGEVYEGEKGEVGLARENTLLKLAEKIRQPVYDPKTPIPLSTLQRKTDEGIPVIFYYRFGHAANHIFLISKTLNVEWNDYSSKCFLEIKDPWPTGRGTEYFLSYESYCAQPDSTNICFWDKSEDDPSIDNQRDIYTDSVHKTMYDTPEDVAQNFFENIIKYTEKEIETELLKKIGLTANDKVYSSPHLSATSFKVKDIGKEIKLIKDDEIRESNLNNIIDFEKRVYFLTQNNRVITAITISKSVSIRKYKEKWYIHTIENGNRYNKIIKKIQSPNILDDLILFRSKSDQLDGEFIARKKPTKMSSNSKKKLTYKITDRI